MKKIYFFLLVFCSVQFAFAQSELTVLFTHDLHSAFLGTNNGKGGYARLFTVIENERAKNPEGTLLLDAGDVAMGSFFHSLFTTESAELRLMGQMGYDATTIGNHDFDFGLDALAAALNIAKSHSPVPALIAANIKYATHTALIKAMQNYGVQEYIIFEKAGLRIGVFGLLGDEAFDNSPNAAILHFETPVDCAQRIVKILREKEKVDVVICLSHSGIHATKKYSEDEILAEKVQGIDLLLSGHSHTVLPQPIIVNHTIIASAGAYGEYLGVVNFHVETKKVSLVNYKLLEINSLIPENREIKKHIDFFKEKVNEQYLQPLGLQFDDTVANSNFDLPAQADAVGESALGNLIADAYARSAKCNGHPTAIGIAASGAIRDNLHAGIINETMVFNVLSLGIGADGKAGYPLVMVYLTGKELWDLCELDASISPILPYAQLFFSGLHYEYNPHRLFCNKVTDVKVMDETGSYVSPDPEKLYAVTASFYSAQMLRVVKSKTFRILSLVPKTAGGAPLSNYVSAILKDAGGSEVKEWMALENYLRELKTLPLFYAESEGRKVRDESNSLGAKIAHPNEFAWLVYSASGLIFAIFLLCVFFAVRKIRHRNKKRSQKLFIKK